VVNAAQGIALERATRAFVLAIAVAVAAGCGSSAETEPVPDSAVRDAMGQPDAPPDTSDAKNDIALPGDAKADDGPSPDVAIEVDVPGSDVAASTREVAAVDAFVPSPVEPLVVNSGNTAAYSLAEGTWKVFSFDTIADHLYCVSGLGSGAVGYVGTSPSVSPTEYVEKTNDKGFLSLSPYANGTYYIAVVAGGGSASGSFQVADGGELITSGDNPVTLTAPDGGDSYRFFRFTIAPGHSYSVSVTGEAKNPVGLGLSPRADRASDGLFAFPLSSTTGPLPIIDAPIPLESAAASLSRFYFLFLRVQETVSLTITVKLAT
jgi:hypothetical protein